MSDALEVAQAALAAAGGDAEAVAHAENSGLARFAGSEIHQPTLIENAVVTLRVVRDGRIGVATTNRLDEVGLKALAKIAGEAADGSPVDPDFPGLATPASFPDVVGYDDATASIGPEDQARLAGDAIAAADVPVYGFFTSGVSDVAVASSTGLEAQQRLTDASVLVVAADDGRSGYAEATSWRAHEIDVTAVAREATAKAARTIGAKTIEPGLYPAVLEPYALAELLQTFAYDSFGALAIVEERGYLAGRLGQRIFDEKITIADDALDPRGLPKAFDFEGSPKQRVDLISDGVARAVVWDRRTARRAGKGVETTGHSPPPDYVDWGPLPTALVVQGGEAETVEELVSAIGDGLYITRLHYLGAIDTREGVITGTTRDGTFRIRNGKVEEPLVNLRFTVAVPELLGDVPGLTRDVTLVNASNYYGERYPHGSLVPAVATARFNVTGTGSAPGI